MGENRRDEIIFEQKIDTHVVLDDRLTYEIYWQKKSVTEHLRKMACVSVIEWKGSEKIAIKI